MVGFTPVEEVERILVVPREEVEKAVRDFFREEWVEEPRKTMLTEDLVVVVVRRDRTEVVEAEEGTLVEAVEIILLTPVGEGEDLIYITPEQISRRNVVLTKLAMVT